MLQLEIFFKDKQSSLRCREILQKKLLGVFTYAKNDRTIEKTWRLVILIEL